LIEIFERLFNPIENGHLETGGLSYLSGVVINQHVCQLSLP